MENRAYALLTGLFILAMGAGVVAAILWLGGTSQPHKPYVVITTGSVSGLSAEATVTYRGVTVGKVTSIRFAPDNLEKIQIGITVNANIPLTDTTYAQLRPEGVTGLSELVLHDKNGKRGKPLQTSAAHPAHIPMQPSFLQTAKRSAGDILNNIKKLLNNLNAVLGSGSDNQLPTLIDSLQQAANGVVKIEHQLNPTLAQLPQLTHNINALVINMNRISQQLQGIGTSLKQTANSMQQLGASSDTTVQRFNNQTLPQVNQVLSQLQTTARQFDKLARQLQRHPQSLIYGQPHPPPGPGEEPP